MGLLERHIRRLVNTIIWSWQGWQICWREELSFRQWVLLNVLSILAASLIDFTALERALIIGLGLLVLVVELLNTAIESAVDHISAEQHPLAKKAKDAGSAAVAVAALATGVVWVILLLG